MITCNLITRQPGNRMGEDNIAAMVRKKWDGDPKRYLTLGELVSMRCKGHEVTVADLAVKLKQGKLGQDPSLIEIIKKRAAYQQYLENRKAREAKKGKDEKKFGDVQFPDIHFPEFMLKS